MDKRPHSRKLQPNHLGAERARDLRQNSSPPERILWKRLRGQRLAGLKFRRQHPMGPFVADFYCVEAGLVLEIDGRAAHSGQRREHDRSRDAWMTERGVEVVRISAADVTTNLDGVLAMITHVAQRRIEQIDGRGAPSATNSTPTPTLPREARGRGQDKR